MSYAEPEKRDIEVEVGGSVRVVTIKRYTENHCWHLDRDDARHSGVLFRFKTGKKRHVMREPQVIVRDGKGRIPQSKLYRSYIFPIRWATGDDVAQKSDWSRA